MPQLRRYAAFFAIATLIAAPGVSLAHPTSTQQRKGKQRVQRARGKQRRTFQLKDINRDNYPDGGFEPKVRARDFNCGHCVVMLDATLAGNPAVALPTRDPRGWVGATGWFRDRFNGGKEGLVVPRVGMVVHLQDGKRVRNVDVAPRTILEKAMADFGPGARAVVIGYYKNEAGELTSHTFNAVNQRGRVKFLDAQLGRSATVSDAYTHFELIRTDK